MPASTPPPDGDAFAEQAERDALPAEVRPLAAELRRHADQLSTTYPPQWIEGRNPAEVASRARRSDSPARRRRVVGWLTVATAALALGVLAWQALPSPLAESDAGGRGHAEERLSNASPDRVRSALVDEGTEDLTLPKTTPAMFVGGLTGPELEGWLDLQRDEHSDRVRISL